MKDPQTYKYKFYYVEDEKRIPDTILNTNAFHDSDNTILSAAKARLAIFLYNSNRIVSCVNTDIETLFERTSDPRTPIDELSEPLVRQGAVAIYDGVSYQVALHGLLYALKSFLDVFSFFVAKYLKPDAKAISFGKGRVGGNKISGGSFINWLLNTKFDNFPSRDALADLLECHSRKWIDQAISYRDDLTHRTSIRGFIDMHVVLDHKRPYIKRENIDQPSMPDGTNLTQYSKFLVDSLMEFIVEVLEILPKVDRKLITCDMSLATKGGTRIRIEHDVGR
jgi:hypothetical protein